MSRTRVTAAAVLVVCAGGAVAGWKAHAPGCEAAGWKARSPVATSGDIGWTLREPAQPENAQPNTQPKEKPAAEEPFVGISVRDTPEGVVVGWIFPGPAGGDGFNSSLGLTRGDNIDALYAGEAIDAEHRVVIESAQAFKDFIATLTPGEKLTIEARRSPEAVPTASIPKGGLGGEVTTYTITVAPKSRWTGTIKRGLGGRTIAEVPEGEFEALILDLAAEVGVRKVEGGLDGLLPYLQRVQKTNLDPNSLPCVVRGFARPLSIDTVEGEIARLAGRAADGLPEHVGALVAQVLDLPEHNEVARLAAMEGVDPAQLRDDLRGLVAWQRTQISVGGPGAESQIRGINTTQGRVGLHLAALLREGQAAAAAWEHTAKKHAGAAPMGETPEERVPERVRTAVTGTILAVITFDDDSIGIVGGAGMNTYDMAVISKVYDIGGDDVYRFAQADDAPTGGNHHIIDLAGHDTYEATTGFAGPGVGMMGLSIVDDRAGDDTYRSAEQFSIGAGLFGVGLLLDHAGNDRYENLGPNSGWSIGVGYYGAGLVIDMAGNDTYHGEQLTQGVGGPRGFGAIIDAVGDDAYKANGPSFGSVYGTADVYKGFSQGFGIGVRSYAAGGLGAIYDFAGNDRYEAGEFAQGCGYYFAMGVLHDAKGDDVYVGNRYGQASAAHQAIGVLIDDAGDDSYWSMTAASQAGVWDQSLAVLIDREGNDTYQADGLAQGSAAMQAIGILLDLEGDDAYTAKGNAQQGQGGSNTYHFAADGMFSFSALIDLGSGADAYSPGRSNGTAEATGARHEDEPAQSSLFGVFCDR